MEYFDINLLLAKTNRELVKTGRKYFNFNKITEFSFSDDIEGIKIEAICNKYKLYLTFDESKIKHLYCQCSIGRYSVLCKHEIASLFKYQQLSEQQFLKENALDPTIAEFFKFLMDNQLFWIYKKVKKIEVICQVEITFDMIKIISINEELIDEVCKYNSILLKWFVNFQKTVSEEKIANEINSFYNRLAIIIFIKKAIFKKTNYLDDSKIIEFLDIRNANQELFILSLGINKEIKNEIVFLTTKDNIDLIAMKTNIGFVISINAQFRGNFFVNNKHFLIYDKLEKTYFTEYDPLLTTFDFNSKINMNTKSIYKAQNRIFDIMHNGIIDINLTTNFYEENIAHKLVLEYDFELETVILKFKIAEQEVINKIITDHFKYLSKKYETTNKVILIETDEEFFKVIQTLQELFNNEKFIIKIATYFTKKKLLAKKKFTYHCNYDGSVIKLSLKNDVITNNDDFKKLVIAYNEHRSHILVKGELFALNEFSLDELKNNLKTINLDVKDIDFDNNLVNKVDLLYLGDNFGITKLKSITDDVLTSEVKLNISDFLTKTLKDYQVIGIQWMKRMLEFSNGCILADEMGLGKTIQTIALLNDYYNSAKKLIKPTLIICPLTLVSNWRNEFLTFDYDQKIILLNLPKEERRSFYADIQNHSEIYITTYNLAIIDVEFLSKIDFEYIILDEGQNIKNHYSKQARAIKSFTSNNRVILSGTPIENNLYELWSLFDFILPNYLSTLKYFRNTYLKNESPKMIDMLLLKTKPFILTRYKKDHLKELKGKVLENIFIDFSKEERNIYTLMLKNVKKEILVSIENGVIKKDRISILSLITKLRQFCCNPQLLGFKNITESKSDFCIDLIQRILKNKDDKIILFCSFVELLEIISKKLDVLGILHYKLIGTTNKHDRINIVNDFNNHQDKRIILISLKTGGVGLNLIGGNNIIHYNPWWNESSEKQATDRAHRIGQTKEVKIFKLIMKESIEEDILKLKNTKTTIINKAINDRKIAQLFYLIENKDLN